ncbi:hypothetical protein BDA99DRAFT_559788 [Phascolomyces articulosus]|uniref:F-box domain-containing protein n=1 Tax=Phascolomyces articulosus TaxID=60185 RepID=A0AAD5PDQ7_9FUNG|nr:hypothetical protein BDA99DRAFT_559788 [Phascolomyces articulosus]
MLIDLPMEVIDLIADQLLFKDFVTCLYVNHAWHDLFERILYRSVDTNDRSMFLVFRKRLNMTAQNPFPLGHYVRELKLCDGFMTQKQMMELQQLCPHIIALTFRWQDTKTHAQNVAASLANGVVISPTPTTSTMNDDNIHAQDNHATMTERPTNRRYFGIPKRMMEMFPTITRLTLECEPKSRRSRPAPQLYNSIHAYLHATHHLHSLTLTNVIRKLTFSQLDIIHEACPQLIQLTISIKSIDYYSGYMDMTHTTTTDTIGSPSTAEASLLGESDERLRHLDGPEWPTTPGGRPLRLQHISMCDQSGLIHLEKWIRYFAARYPELRSFSIRNWCWERSLGWLPGSHIPHPWQYVPQMPTSSGTTTVAAVRAESSSSAAVAAAATTGVNYMMVDHEENDNDGLLATHCPELHTIELFDVIIPSNAMKHLFAGRKLTQVSMKCQGSNVVDERGFMEMIRYLQPKIVHLGISIPAPFVCHALPFQQQQQNDASASSAMNIWHPYSTFEHLVELEIICCGGRWFEPVQFIMDHVLRTCPVLKQVTLVNVSVKATLSPTTTAATAVAPSSSVAAPVTTSHSNKMDPIKNSDNDNKQKMDKENDVLIFPSLMTLKLRNVDLRCGSLMKFLSRQCPRLLHLHMFRCTGPQQHLNYVQKDGARFAIDLPFHSLESLVIYEQHMVNKPAHTNVVAIVMDGSQQRQQGQNLYDHCYWVPEETGFNAMSDLKTATTPMRKMTSYLRSTLKTQQAYYNDFSKLNFDDTLLVRPPFPDTLQGQRILVKKWPPAQCERLLNPKNSTQNQNNNNSSNNHNVTTQQQQAWMLSSAFRKRKHNQDQANNIPIFKERWMNGCTNEMITTGYLSIRCKSVSKLIFNGAYLIHRGASVSPSSE